MDGEVGDGQQRLVPRDNAPRRLHGVVRAQKRDARQRQRPVEPGVENRAAVRLDGQAAAAAGNQLRLRLDAQAGPVGVRGGDAEVIGLLSDRKGGEEGAVFDEIAAAGRDVERAAGCERSKALRGEEVRREAHGMVR